MDEKDWRDSILSTIDAWNGKHVVVSPDVDGVLSGCLMCHQFGAKIAGSYDGRFLVLFDGVSPTEIREALWVDNDISHPGILCIGQHLLNHDSRDQMPLRDPRSFNPNEFFSQDWYSSFKARKLKDGQYDKYPFATIHLLLEALQIKLPRRLTTHYHLLAHADGTWVVCRDHPVNATSWRDRMFPGGNALIDYLIEDYVQYQDNQLAHGSLVKDLRMLMVSKDTATRRNKIPFPGWDEFRGNQDVKFTAIWRKKALRGDSQGWLQKKFSPFVKYISEKTAWKTNCPKEITEIHRGRILEVGRSSEIMRGNFDSFMVSEGIFSHAIIFPDCLRFTKHISIDEKINSLERIF